MKPFVKPGLSVNKNLKVLGLIIVSLFALISCQTTEVAKIKPTSPTFSVYSGKTDPLMCNVQGEMKGCRADWTVTSGILTHRQVCESSNKKFIQPMLKAMARTLSQTCNLKIKYARMTTKDDPQAEMRLAKMMSQSRLWNRYSRSKRSGINDKKVAKFPSKFIKKVVQVKGVFSEVTEALNDYGYDFVVEKVEVTDLNPLTESRHFKTLMNVKTQNSFIVPENIRIVWLNKDFKEGQPQRLRVPQKVNATKTLQNRLPSKKSF